MGFATLQFALGVIADQASGIAHLVHYRIAGVDTGAATDAVDLQTVTDIDSGRADLHAHVTVDAIAQAFSLVVAVFPARAPAFTAPGVVRSEERRVGKECR